MKKLTDDIAYRYFFYMLMKIRLNLLLKRDGKIPAYCHVPYGFCYTISHRSNIEEFVELYSRRPFSGKKSGYWLNSTDRIKRLEVLNEAMNESRKNMSAFQVLKSYLKFINHPYNVIYALI